MHVHILKIVNSSSQNLTVTFHQTSNMLRTNLSTFKCTVDIKPFHPKKLYTKNFIKHASLKHYLPLPEIEILIIFIFQQIVKIHQVRQERNNYIWTYLHSEEFHPNFTSPPESVVHSSSQHIRLNVQPIVHNKDTQA